MYEFVARKGLISLQSSSFEQTLRVSGSISSPTEAFLTSSWSRHSVTASYIDPINIVGATSASIPNTIALRDSIGGTGFKHLLFDTGSSGYPAETGLVSWNTFDGTLNVHTDVPDVVVQVGQEMLVKARNNTGAIIPNGSAVYISGSIGNRPLMYLACATSSLAVSKLIGLSTATVLDNEDSYITVAGKVNDLNTAMYTEGDIVYLSSVPGEVSLEIPVGVEFPISMGTILRAHPTHGTILVAIKQEFHTFNELIGINKLGVGVVTASVCGTASWALNSITSSLAKSSSYVITDYDKLYTSIATSSQSIVTPSVWQEIQFNANSHTSSYWAHTSNTGQYTCSKSDIYEIGLVVRSQKTSGGNQSAGVRILKDGNEITGSYSAITYTANNIASDMHVNMIEPIMSGSAIRVEIIGTATTIQTTSFPIFGTFPGFSYSSKILIMKT